MSRFILCPWQVAAVTFILAASRLLASPPSWWAERGVLNTGAAASDYAVVNLGQVKRIATLARDEMEAKLQIYGGAGYAINSMVDSWSQPPANGVTRNDYAVVNLGQLKSLAKLYYDRLALVGYSGQPLAGSQTYPWTSTTTDDKDYAVANIGQVKCLFSFNLAPLAATSVTGLTVSSLTAESLVFSWTAPTAGATLYEVFRNGVSLGTTTGTSVQVTGLTELTTYSFTVRSRDAANIWSAQSTPHYIRTWDRKHQWGFTLEYTEGQDEEGYGNGQWEYSTTEWTFWADGQFKVYTNSTGISMTLKKEVGGQTLGTSNGSVISYTSPSNQMYRVFLTNGDGDYSIMVDVPPPTNQPPVANFNASLSSGRSPLAVSFSNSGSSDPDGLIIAYNWDFDGNGSIDATGTTASCTYSNAGNSPLIFTAKLAVVDSAGATGTLIKDIAVYPASSFSVGVQSGTTSLPYQIAGSAVTLVAAAPPSGQQFGSWTIVSGSGTFSNASSATTTFVVGSADTVVKANYISDTTAPSVPTGLATVAQIGTGLAISWSAAIDNTGVTGYEVFRNGVSAGTTTTTNIKIGQLTPNTTYQITVRARDAAGNWSAQSSVLHARTWHHQHHWSGTMTYEEGQDEEGYGNGQWEYSSFWMLFTASGPFRVSTSGVNVKLRVYGGTTSGGPILAETTDGSWLYYTATGTQQFSVMVTEGIGDFEVFVDVPGSNVLPIANFVATPTVLRGSGSVAFDASSSLDSDGPAGSLLYTWDLDGNGSLDASGVTTTRTYTHTGNSVVSANAVLTVTDIGGGSATVTKAITLYPLNSHSVTVQDGTAAAPYVLPNGSVALVASAPPVGMAFASWTLVSGNGAITDPSSKTTTFISGGSGGNIVVKANYVQDIVVPTVPTNLSLGSVTASSVALAWSPSTDNVGVTSYEIYSDSTLLGTTTSTQITLNSLSPANSYRFAVRAVDAAGLRSGFTGAILVTTWQRVLSGSGTIESEEGSGTAVTFNFTVPTGGYVRAYSTGSIALRGRLAGTETWDWIEGNGGNFSGLQVLAAGAYTITVRGQDEYVEGDFQVFVDFGQALRPDFSATPGSGSAPLTVSFDATRSFAPSGGPITSYAWDFDNNGTTDSTQPIVTKVYTGSEVYTARLTVANGAGVTGTITRKIVTKSADASASGAAAQAGASVTPAPTVSPGSGKIGAQVTVSAPAYDSAGNPFYAWYNAIVENTRNPVGTMSLSQGSNHAIASYWIPSTPNVLHSSISLGTVTAMVNQPFTVSLTSSGTELNSHRIDYTTDFGAYWVNGTLTAGTRWQYTPTGQAPLVTTHTDTATFSFPNPGWVYFRTYAIREPNTQALPIYGKVLITTGGEGETITVLNGTASAASGPSGTVVNLTPNTGTFLSWWEVLHGSGTFNNPYLSSPTFTKGSGPVIIRANPGVPSTLTVLKGTSNKTTGALGSEFLVVADPPPGNYVFDRWKVVHGPGQFAAEKSASTSFFMGDSGATVEATYKPAGSPSVAIAMDKLAVTENSIVTVTVTAFDPDENLKEILIDHRHTSTSAWTLAATELVGVALDSTRWSASAAGVGSKSISVRFRAPPMLGGGYRFLVRAVDFHGHVADPAEAGFGIVYPQPVTRVVASYNRGEKIGTADAGSPPSITVETGQSFTITAQTIENSWMKNQVIDLWKHGTADWSPGAADNQRLWMAPDGYATPITPPLVKVFSATELGVGTHRFRARGADSSNVNSDYKYVNVVVTAPAEAGGPIFDPPPSPDITSQPVNVSITTGQTANFSVVATGMGPLVYQWRKDGRKLDGETSPTLTIANASGNHQGSYEVVVNNAGGDTRSTPATLTVAPVGPIDPNDTDGDGVDNATEILLGLNPNDPTDVSVSRYEYDKINQLKRGPGGAYVKDKEGNIKSVTP